MSTHREERRKRREAAEAYSAFENQINAKQGRLAEKIKLMKKERAQECEETGYLLFLGEKAPGVNVDTSESSLEMALRWLKALDVKFDIQVGLTTTLDIWFVILNIAKRRGKLWMNPATMKLSPREFAGESSLEWEELPGENEPITTKRLQAARKQARLDRYIETDSEPERSETLTTPTPAPKTEIQEIEERIHSKPRLTALYSATLGEEN